MIVQDSVFINDSMQKLDVCTAKTEMREKEWIKEMLKIISKIVL